jgi:hypothetical protein
MDDGLNARWFASRRGGPIDRVNVFSGSTKLATFKVSTEVSQALTSQTVATNWIRNNDILDIPDGPIQHIGDTPWAARDRAVGTYN